MQPKEKSFPDAREDGDVGRLSVDGNAPRERAPPKDSEELKKWIEALLFAAGRYMTLAELAELCAVKEPGLIREAIKELRETLEHMRSPLAIVGTHDAWKLSVIQEYLPIVEGIMPEMELDKPLLETLAVIAWRQPILQSEVIKIRSTTAYDHIRALLDKNFITREKYGKSYILKTTKQFEEYFELPGKEAARKLFAGIEGELERSMKRKERFGDLTTYRVQEQQKKQEKEEPNVELYFDDEKKQERQEKPSENEQDATEGGVIGGQENQEREDSFEHSAEEELREQESDETRTKRIIEELVREDEPDNVAGEDVEDVHRGEEDGLHPALARFAAKVPLPTTAVKNGARKEAGKKSQGSETQAGGNDKQDSPEEE